MFIYHQYKLRFMIQNYTNTGLKTLRRVVIFLLASVMLIGLSAVGAACIPDDKNFGGSTSLSLSPPELFAPASCGIPCPGCNRCVTSDGHAPLRWLTFGGQGYGSDFHLGNYQFGEIRTFSQIFRFNPNPPDNNPRYDWWVTPIITEVVSATIVSTSGTIHCGLELGLVNHPTVILPCGQITPFGQINIRFGPNLPGIPAGHRHNNDTFPWQTITLVVHTLCGPQEVTITNHFNPCTQCDFECCDYCQWRAHTLCPDCGACTQPNCSGHLTFRWDMRNNGIDGFGNPDGYLSIPCPTLKAANSIRMYPGFGGNFSADNNRQILHRNFVAVDQDGNCANHLVTVVNGSSVWCNVTGQWIRPYFRSIDVDKNASWKWIDFTINVCGQPYTARLVNGNFIPITFDLNGGSAGGVAEIVHTLQIGTSITTAYIPAPVHLGHTLSGWQLNSTGTKMDETQVAAHTVNGPVTFIAQWTPEGGSDGSGGGGGGTGTGNATISAPIGNATISPAGEIQAYAIYEEPFAKRTLATILLFVIGIAAFAYRRIEETKEESK